MPSTLSSSKRFPLAWDNAYVYCFKNYNIWIVVFITKVHIPSFDEAVLQTLNQYWLATPELQETENAAIFWYACADTASGSITFQINVYTRDGRKSWPVTGPYCGVDSHLVNPTELKEHLGCPIPPVPATDEEIRLEFLATFNYDRFESRD